jgi:hypothetical protein
MSNHSDSTLEWYINWLAERHPEWSPEQRLEVATGFVAQQQPLTPKEEEPDYDEIPLPETPETRREAKRADARLHKFIGGLLKEAGE